MYVGHSHYSDLPVCQPAACLHGCSVKVICNIRYFFCAIDYKLVMEFISQQQSSVIDLRSLKIAFYDSDKSAKLNFKKGPLKRNCIFFFKGPTHRNHDAFDAALNF